MADRPKKPPIATSIADVMARVLDSAGLRGRVAQAGVIPEWPGLVGPTIAGVTEPVSISSDGTLLVAVRTNAWMNELSLLEPELLRALNRDAARPPIVRLRMRLMR